MKIRNLKRCDELEEKKYTIDEMLGSAGIYSVKRWPDWRIISFGDCVNAIFDSNDEDFPTGFLKEMWVNELFYKCPKDEKIVLEFTND